MDAKDVVGLAGLPVVIALVEAVKRIWPTLEPRWYPAVSVGSALAINIGFAVTQVADLKLAVLYGIVVGLTASGIYSGGATVGIRGQ